MPSCETMHEEKGDDLEIIKPELVVTIETSLAAQYQTEVNQLHRKVVSVA